MLNDSRPIVISLCYGGQVNQKGADVSKSIGQYVWCSVCPLPKAPRGRSLSAAAANGYCDSDCSGYDLDPPADRLFPGESDVDNLRKSDD